MQELIVVVDEITDFTSMNIEIIVKDWMTKNEIGMGKVMQPFRLSLVGALRPSLTSLSLLEKKKRSQEFKSCSKFIKSKVPIISGLFLLQVEDNIPFSIPDFL
jgi:hypothetical protein